MKRCITILLASIILCLFSGCSDHDCNAATQVPSCLSTMGCGQKAHRLVVDTDNDFELIRSQEQYDTKVMGDCQVEIDWLQYDLVIGNIQLPNQLESIDKKLSHDCNNNIVNLYMTFLMKSDTPADSICWSALIPKLGDSETVFVNL